MKQHIYSKDILLVLAASFFYMASPMLVTPLITGFTESIGSSAALMGIVGGMMNLCSLVCRPLAGNLADRMSKYKVSVIGAVLMTAACVGYIMAPNAAVIVVSRIINGVGFACCSVCMATWMSNMLPKDKIGSGMGFYGTMNALAMAAAPAIGVSVYQMFGYRIAFFIALLFSVSILVVVQFIRDKGEPDNLLHENRAKDPALQKERSVHCCGSPSECPENLRRIQLIDIKVVPIALIIMLFAIPYCATQSFLVTYAEARHLNITVSIFFPVYALVLIVLRLSLRNLFDKLPFGIFLIAGSVSLLFAIFCLAGMQNNQVMFLACIFLAGGYGIMSSVCQSTAILLAGKEKRGLANSTYYIGLDLGMALGPMIGGLLYGQLDIRMFYPTLLVTVPLVGVVYAFAGKRLRMEKKNRNQN